MARRRHERLFVVLQLGFGGVAGPSRRFSRPLQNDATIKQSTISCAPLNTTGARRQTCLTAPLFASRRQLFLFFVVSFHCGSTDLQLCST